MANAQKAAPDVRIPEPPTTPPSAFVDEVKQVLSSLLAQNTCREKLVSVFLYLIRFG